MTAGVSSGRRATGLEWAPSIPAHWSVAPLYARFSVQLGKMLDEKRNTGEGSAPYLRNVDVQWGRINVQDLPRMDFSEEDRQKFGLLPGDVLVCEGGDVGRASVWTGGEGECFYQKALHRLRRLGDDDPRFMYYLLYAAAKRGVFTAGSNASTIAHLTGEKLRAQRFPFPPPREQRAIATFLDEKFSAIDGFLAEEERLAGLLRARRAAAITRAITTGLNNAATRASGHPWLGDMPEHWSCRQLRELTQPERPIMYGIVLPGPHVEDGVPIVKGGNCRQERLRLGLLSRTTPEIEAAYARSRLMAGDIVYAIRGGVGECAIVPNEVAGANLTQDAARVAPAASVDASWLLYALQAHPVAEQARSLTAGATVKGLNIRDLKRLALPVPPLPEQQRIGRFVAEEVRKAELLEAAVRRQADDLEQYRLALVMAAVTGQVTAGLRRATPTPKPAWPVGQELVACP